MVVLFMVIRWFVGWDKKGTIHLCIIILTPVRCFMSDTFDAGLGCVRTCSITLPNMWSNMIGSSCRGGIAANIFGHSTIWRVFCLDSFEMSLILFVSLYVCNCGLEKHIWMPYFTSLATVDFFGCPMLHHLLQPEFFSGLKTTFWCPIIVFERPVFYIICWRCS
jgi:hypothetical protein